jgi:hypothetical protein
MKDDVSERAMSNEQAELFGVVCKMHTAWMRREEMMRQQGGFELIARMATLLDEIVDDVPRLWRVVGAALTPTPPKGDLCERLLLAIQHGDEEHRAWLRDAIDAFFTGEPVPAPRGGGRKEARIKALEAENARLREDWVAAAAMYTLDAADAPPARRSGDGDGPEHASWMLHEIVNQRIAGRKAHRWLGYAQGILVAADWLTLEQAKLANKRASDECSLLSTPPEQPVDGEG